MTVLRAFNVTARYLRVGGHDAPDKAKFMWAERGVEPVLADSLVRWALHEHVRDMLSRLPAPRAKTPRKNNNG